MIIVELVSVIAVAIHTLDLTQSWDFVPTLLVFFSDEEFPQSIAQDATILKITRKLLVY